MPSADTDTKTAENGTRAGARTETTETPSTSVVSTVTVPEVVTGGPPLLSMGETGSSTASAAALPQRKIGMVGYTTSREEAPYDDPEWELWGMNNLHLALPEEKFARWYNLHVGSPASIAKLALPKEKGGDPEHLAWLQQEHSFPIYLMDPLEGVLETPDGNPVPSIAERTGFPSARTFPKIQILGQFIPYFTNTVAWQIAHAMFEGMSDNSRALTDIGLYGIDMATGTEYSKERPSVEYYLGLIHGCGLELHLPAASDLLKSAELYGGDDSLAGPRAKIQTRLRELNEQKANLEQQLGQGQQMLAQVQGAIDSFAYIGGVWFPNAAAGPDGRDKQAPAPGSGGAVGQLLADLDARERAPKET